MRQNRREMLKRDRRAKPVETRKLAAEIEAPL